MISLFDIHIYIKIIQLLCGFLKAVHLKAYGKKEILTNVSLTVPVIILRVRALIITEILIWNALCRLF